MAQDLAFSPDPSQHNFTSSEYVADGAGDGDGQVQPYDSTQDAQQWYDDNVNEDAHQKAERLNRLRLQLERAAAREGTSTGAILERLEEYAPARAVWTEYFDEENTPFYVNEATGETRWQLPRPEELGLELALDALLCDDPKQKEEKLAELAKKKAIDDESSLMTGEDYSLEPEETEEERIEREARELEERLAWEESERLRIEQERIDDEHFRRGQAEAKQASVSLLARNFYFSIKDEACTKRVQDWLTEKRDAHEAQQREMYRTIKAELKVIVRRPILCSRVERRGDGATPSSRDRAQVCPAPKPINEFAEALAAAARADAGEEGANKAVDACEPVWKATSTGAPEA